jgi:hypothetical protein
MSKVTNKLASGIRKVKQQQPAPVVVARQPARRPSRGKAERPAMPGRADSGGFLHPARVWPD